MDVKTDVREYLVTQHLNTVKFIDGFYLYKQALFVEDKIISNKYGILRKDPCEAVDLLHSPTLTNIGVYTLAVVRKNFLDAYKTSGLGLESYKRLIELWVPYDEIFRNLSCGGSIDEYALVAYNPCEGRYYNIDGTWLEHFEKYNNGSYSVTDKYYNLEDLYQYLITCEDVKVTTDINFIPYYDRDGEGSRYINFYVRITPERYPEFSEAESRFENIPKTIIDISKFKRE